MNKTIEEYWSRFEFGRMMLMEPGITEQDLLLFMPNNAKKMLGLPMSRSNGRRKTELKKKRIARLEAFVSSVIERMIWEILPKKTEELFASFAPVNTLHLGDLYEPE